MVTFILNVCSFVHENISNVLNCVQFQKDIGINHVMTHRDTVKSLNKFYNQHVNEIVIKYASMEAYVLINGTN